jgi:hypothetical protein
MGDQRRIARIGNDGIELVDQSELAIDLAQEQRSGIGGDDAPGKIRDDMAGVCPIFREGYNCGSGWRAGEQGLAMDRLLTMDKEQFIARMQAEFRQTFEQIADAVNDARDGNVISGSEMRVRDVMAELRRKAFETAVQMRIDSTESSFSPSQGRVGQQQTKQGALQPQHAERQRAPQSEPGALARRRRRK